MAWVAIQPEGDLGGCHDGMAVKNDKIGGGKSIFNEAGGKKMKRSTGMRSEMKLTVTTAPWMRWMVG